LTKPIYKCDGIDADGLIEDQISETGLYWRHRLKIWQVWHIDDDGNKSVVGECTEQLGEEAAQAMWNEFVYVAANKISGVDDLVAKGEIN